MLAFFINDTTTTEIYTLSLHDALPISSRARFISAGSATSLSKVVSAPIDFSTCSGVTRRGSRAQDNSCRWVARSEEHTSELQSRQYLECCLLLEKKQKILSVGLFARDQ